MKMDSHTCNATLSRSTKGKGLNQRSSPTKCWQLQLMNSVSKQHVSDIVFIFSLLQIFGTLVSTFWALINYFCVPFTWGASPASTWRTKLFKGENISQKWEIWAVWHLSLSFWEWNNRFASQGPSLLLLYLCFCGVFLSSHHSAVFRHKFSVPPLPKEKPLDTLRCESGKSCLFECVEGCQVGGMEAEAA